MSEENLNQEVIELKNKIAFIIDNEVAIVLGCNEELYSILLSNPVLKDVSNKFTENNFFIERGNIYNPETDSYTKP
jgi:hypothetical protein